jgi:hypothetical protein
MAIMHGIVTMTLVPEEWPTVSGDDDEIALRKIEGKMSPSLEHFWKIITDTRKARMTAKTESICLGVRLMMDHLILMQSTI